jgi:hypothetical protein
MAQLRVPVFEPNPVGAFFTNRSSAMTRQLIAIAVTSFVLSAPVESSAQDPDQTPSPTVMQAVEAAFPQALRYAKEPASEDDYGTCASVFSRSADGTPSLIAAAYDGDGAEIVMLAYASSGATIISAVTNQQFWLTDKQCELQVVSLADPDHPDSPLAKTIDVRFGGPDWFFTWDGEKLQNITALQKSSFYWSGKEVPNSDIYGALIVDIDHSGPMQIVGTNGDGDQFPDDDGISSTGTTTLFRYNGTMYAPVQTVLFIGGYMPNLPNTPDEKAKYTYGTPPWVFSIAMHQTPAPSYQLKIVNGDRDGSNRVTSAKVELNGATIILPTEINQTMGTLTRTIHLQKKNKIKVTVDGPAKSHLYVVVE